jgi:hypothetical protein
MCRPRGAPTLFKCAPAQTGARKGTIVMALTPDEHEELRRIHVLAQFGDLPDIMQARYRELRARDDSLDIPEPTLDVEWMPIQRNREEAADDAVDALLAIVDDETDRVTVGPFEPAFARPDAYVVPSRFNGFVPSQRYSAP